MRLRIDLAYDGTDFSGWAIQPNKRSVQEELEKALFRVVRPKWTAILLQTADPNHNVTFAKLTLPQDILTKLEQNEGIAKVIKTIVAGRTDAGVHAEWQTVHIDLAPEDYFRLPGYRRIGSAKITPEQALLDKLSAVIPNDIQIKQIRLVPDTFSARFSALSRTYVYRIADCPESKTPFIRRFVHFAKHPLDIDAINEGAHALLGLHDFAAFSKPRPNIISTTIRDLREFSWKRVPFGVQNNEIIEVRITADAFTHNMVRSLVGSCIFVGEGKKPKEWLKEKLDTRVREGKTGPIDPRGLSLKCIQYPDKDVDFEKQNAITKSVRKI
jgi:tRNA pseudouridine38-40 synthase